MDAARSLNFVQAVKTETVQTRQLLWISECTHTHRTGYFIMKIVQQGLYIHGKVRNQGYFSKILADQGNGFANEQWILVLWPKLNSVLLANQIDFLDMFWWFDGRIKKHHCIFENCLDYERSLFSVVRRAKRETCKWTGVSDGARRERPSFRASHGFAAPARVHCSH